MVIESEEEMKEIREWIECPAGHRVFEVDIRLKPEPIALIVRCVECDTEVDFPGIQYRSVHMRPTEESN